MRLLAAIPHYFDPKGQGGDGRRHASTAGALGTRLEALGACITALHQLFGTRQAIIDIASRVALPANAPRTGQVDVIVCTTAGRHLLPWLDLEPGLWTRRETDAEPLFLGFECRAALRERLGDYDYYGYFEDDLIVRDPAFLAKLAWFNRHVGDERLLQPNRFEVTRRGVMLKAYLDGELAEDLTRPFQDVHEEPTLRSNVLGSEVVFRRPTNPHAGCYVLNARQMAAWAARDDFLERSGAFIGPLESAATLGIMRAFRVYKPAPENADFLEIEHHGTDFIANLRRRDA